MRNFINIITEAEVNNTGNAVDDPDIEDLGGPAEHDDFHQENVIPNIADMSWERLHRYLLDHNNKHDLTTAVNAIGDVTVQILAEVWPRTKEWHSWTYTCHEDYRSSGTESGFRIKLTPARIMSYSAAAAATRARAAKKNKTYPIHLASITVEISRHSTFTIRINYVENSDEIETAYWRERNWSFKRKFEEFFAELQGNRWPYFSEN